MNVLIDIDLYSLENEYSPATIYLRPTPSPFLSYFTPQLFSLWINIDVLFDIDMLFKILLNSPQS